MRAAPLTAAPRRGTFRDVTDNELIDYAKVAVGREHGLTEAQARRLVGSSLNVLHADAATMAGELGVENRYAPSRDRPVTTVNR